MNILFFTEISPFPINGGEKIRVYGLLKALTEMGHSVKLMCQNLYSFDLQSVKIDNVDIIPFANLPAPFYHKLFTSYYFDINKSALSTLVSMVSSGDIDVIILDFFLAPRYIRYLKKYSCPIIISTHNSESNLAWQQPHKGILGWFRKLENYLIVKYSERFYYKHASRIITVSQGDTDFHKHFYPLKRICMIPNFLDEKLYTSLEERGDHLVMTANFGAYMNVEGLRWFVDYVWNAEIDKSKKLLLVGRKSKEVFEDLRISERYKNIEAIGEVEDTKPFIAKAAAVLIPLVHGSGSRLKCLEAMALKTPIIGTSKGVEGIESDNIFLADSPSDFRDLILNVKYSKSIGDALYEDFLKNYSLSINVRRLDQLLHSVIRS